MKRVKLDVGLSENGRNAIHWLRSDPNLMVIGIEPIPDAIRKLKAMIETLDDRERVSKQLFIVPIALAEEEGQRPFHVTKGHSGYSSLLQPKGIEIDETITVDVVSLDRLLRFVLESGIERIDHLKLDCQGMDLNILRSGGDMISKVAVVTAEPEESLYIGARNSVFEMESYMKSQGFVFINKRSMPRVLLGDVLSRVPFVKNIGIRFPQRLRPDLRKSEARIEVDDPTFVNSRFLSAVSSGEIAVYQRL